MIATCQLCRAIIEAHRGPMILEPGQDPAAIEAVTAISEFDLLAGRMANHISERHRNHAMELSAVGFLACKMYAMVHANSTEEEFGSLRAAWRAGILDMMHKIGTAQDEATALPAPPEGGSVSSPVS